jgi:hypothetical protein
MVFHTKETVSRLGLIEAQDEALRFSNLCKIQTEVVSAYEKQLSKMAEELGAQHQLVLFGQLQLEQMKKKLFGKSSERREDENGLPLFDGKDEEKESVKYERKKRTQFGRTELPELPRVEIRHELSPEEIEAKGLEKMEG